MKFLAKNYVKTGIYFCIGFLFLSFQASAELLEKDKLSIGSDLTYPPYAYMSDNKPAGFDVEFSRLLAKQMGLQPNFVDTRFSSLITGIRSFKFDIIASAMFISEERSKVLDFIPYIKTGNSMMVLKGSSFQPETENDLCGKTIGSIRGGAWVPSLRALSTNYCSKNGKAQLVVNEYDTDPQVTQALRSGTIDVQMSDASVITSVMERFPGQFQVTSHELIYPVLIGIGVGKNNKDISKQISQAFEAVRQDGSYAKLLEKYHFFAPNQNDIDAAINKLK